MFFVFDGMDGAGKSTQLQLFGQHLTGLGCDVVYCKDPGTTDLGNKIREILLQEQGLTIDVRSELLMFMTARAQLTEEFIKPALAAGKTVVCDRYVFSTVVYQGYGCGIEPETVWELNGFATNGLIADLTFVFDMDAEKAMKRLGDSLDRMESRGLGYFNKLRNGFLTESKRWPTGVELIDADGSIKEVHQRVLTAAASTLQKLKTSKF